MKKEVIVAIITIGIAIVLVGFMQYKAKIESMQFERGEEIRKETAREENLNYCMKNAYDIYLERWNSKCEIEKLGEDCVLMKYQRQEIEEDYSDEKDRCIKLYK